MGSELCTIIYIYNELYTLLFQALRLPGSTPGLYMEVTKLITVFISKVSGSRQIVWSSGDLTLY